MLRREQASAFNLPNVLSCARILLAPVLLWLAWNGWNKIFIGCLIFSFASDMIDGWLARKLNCQTEIGARLDSWSDFITWLAMPFCGWWLKREVVQSEWPFLAVAVSFYLAAIGIGFLKFGKLTSYHTYGAKFMAVFAYVGIAAFFITGSPWTIRALAPIVVLTQSEEILTTFALSEWRANVPSLCRAQKIKKDAQII